MQNSLPIQIYASNQVRELDRLAIDEYGISGIVLMRRAAEKAFGVLFEYWPDAVSVGVYCGSGNNAGDGFIIAGLLADRGIQTKVVVVGDPEKLGPDAAEALDFCRQRSVQFCDAALDCNVIVDALLGTGLSGEVRPDYAKVIESINQAGKPVLAVDVPSGLSADTGQSLGQSIDASVTVTFIGLKKGMFTGEGPQKCGIIQYDDLGVPEELFARVESNTTRLDIDNCRSRLPARNANAHKTDFGHVLVAGGTAGMGGAVLMAAEAALRVGAGLVSVATQEENIIPVLSRRPEVMARSVLNDEDLDPMLEKATCIVLGPGLGRNSWSQWLFERLINSGIPGVLDADALNLLSGKHIDCTNWILTPHPGEAARLLGDKDLLQDRFVAVTEIQRRYQSVALLKGAGTLITDGSGISICPYGNPGMATAGMGDVLSGVIGGLLAQGLPARDAAEVGVVLHAYAGDLAAEAQGERGLIATDVIPCIRRLVG